VSGKERAVRIGLGVAFLCLGLWILNYSFYSFWIAGGPPTNYPEIWYQEGIINGWRAVAVLAVAIMVQFRWSTLRRSWVSWALVLAIILGLSYPYMREQMLIDKCLDGGGAWDDKYFRCHH
jgi:hypothetical protein